MNTFLTPGISRSLRRSSTCFPWLASRLSHLMQVLSVQAPLLLHNLQHMEYMFAVGPPTSCTMPLKPGIFTILFTSRMMDSTLRLCTILPWWCVSAQKEHEAKHPRWLTTENLTGASAGIGFL